METPRLALRELEEEDVPAVQVWESDAAVVRYQSTDVATPEESLAYIQRVRQEARLDPRQLYEFGLVRRADRLLIGRAGLRVARPEHREGEIWFVLRRDACGHGYATEAVRALLQLAFGQLDLHRVWGDCDPRNVGSARLMERVGMRREAQLRENWWLKGEWCDSWIYAMLDREWSELASAPKGPEQGRPASGP